MDRRRPRRPLPGVRRGPTAVGLRPLQPCSAAFRSWLRLAEPVSGPLTVSVETRPLLYMLRPLLAVTVMPRLACMAYVALQGSSRLAMIDLESATVVAYVPTGAGPDGIGYSPFGR